jgi:hypothetical protein
VREGKVRKMIKVIVIMRGWGINRLPPRRARRTRRRAERKTEKREQKTGGGKTKEQHETSEKKNTKSANEIRGVGKTKEGW